MTCGNCKALTVEMGHTACTLLCSQNPHKHTNLSTFPAIHINAEEWWDLVIVIGKFQLGIWLFSISHLLFRTTKIPNTNLTGEKYPPHVAILPEGKQGVCVRSFLCVRAAFSFFFLSRDDYNYHPIVFVRSVRACVCAPLPLCALNQRGAMCRGKVSASDPRDPK